MNPALAARLTAMILLVAATAPVVAQPASQPASQPSEQANAPDSNTSDTLRVGIKRAPPFAMRDESGAWSGLAVDLWQRIGDRIGAETTFVERRTAADLIAATEASQVDVAIGALTVTPERERMIDFTQPFYNAGLGIATARGNAGWGATLGRLISWQFVSAVAVLGLVLLGVGAAMWLVERRRNAEQFGGPAGQGIGNGFWWSAVTMTTVGYGDKAPITPAGRVIALVWMFASIITISGFTAAIASAFTVDQLASRVQGPDDLPHVRVATVADTASATYLSEEGIRARGYPAAEAAIDVLAAGNTDAVVHDAPILRAALLATDRADLVVLDKLVRPEDYAFALPQDSALRERINPVLLEIIQGDEWQQLRASYVGR